MEESEKLTEDKKLASDILKEVADTNNNDSDKKCIKQDLI